MEKINVKEQKKKLRKKFKEERLNLPADDKRELEQRIKDRFLNLWSYKECQTLLTYVSTELEIDTKQLILTALSAGKKVAVPYCIDNTFEMDFYYIKSLDDLEARTFGVLEPKIAMCRKVTDFSKAVCCVPALAYDCSGYRLGYGKGYYDRFLNHFSGPTIGLIYSSQLVSELPHGRYDKNVDILITEKSVKPTALL